MTTIATDGRSMAGDGRITRGSLITGGEALKIFRLSDGSLLGGAGDADAVHELREWLDKGGCAKRPKTPNVHMLHLWANGECWIHCDNHSATKTGLPTAIGSGDHLAIGAMEAGATPEEAVAIAAKRDVNTGGRITVLHLEANVKAVA